MPKSDRQTKQSKEKDDWVKAFDKAFDAFLEINRDFHDVNDFVRIDKVQAAAESLNKMIRADDPRLDGSVVVNHEDGSHFFFNYAFVKEFFEWIIVFTEHHGPHVFGKGDLSYWNG